MLSYLVDAGAGSGKRAHWDQIMREVYGPRWSLHPARPEDFRMSMQAVQIGNVTLSCASLSQAEVSARSQATRGTPARAYNLYIVDQRQHLTLGGQRLVLEPGDFTLADASLPSNITTESPYTTIGLTVPESVLRAYVRDPERAVGICFSGSQRLSRVVSATLQDMWGLARAGTLAPVGHRLVVSLFETFAACCELADAPARAETGNVAARSVQIRDAIQTHLRDPDFSVNGLSRELGLSPRYVQRVFGAGGESVREYVRRQRLDGCHRDLADPAWRDHSVTAIAFRWGFNSAAHFCRAFSARYGLSPSEFRQQQSRASQKRHSGLMGVPVAPGMRSGAVVSR